MFAGNKFLSQMAFLFSFNRIGINRLRKEARPIPNMPSQQVLLFILEFFRGAVQFCKNWVGKTSFEEMLQHTK